jgi:hypothetical protein
MLGEVAFYESCQCRETKLLMSRLGIDLLCSHHHSIGAPRPPFPRDIGLVLEEDMQTLRQHDLGFVGHEVAKDDESHMEHFKSLVAKAPKQGTHAFDDRRLLVEAALIMGRKDVLGLPITVLKLISDGVQVFHPKLANKPNETLPIISGLRC